MWKRPTGKRYDFSWPLIRLSIPLCYPSSTENSSTTKERKLTKLFAFCLPRHVFCIQSSQYQYWKASKYSIQALIELGLPVLESSTQSQHIMYLRVSTHSHLPRPRVHLFCHAPSPFLNLQTVQAPLFR